MTKNSIFTIGGTVQAGSGIYLTRQADEDLLAGCLRGAFTYVLTPRQMGKSSLMVATADRLRSQGVRCVIIDLTQIGVQGTTAEQWYLGLLVLIEDQLGLNTDAMQWWQRYSHLSFTQRLTQFFQTVLLVEVQEPVTIFVDEIDSTLSLDFTDDFFAAIRYFFVARAQEVALQRLSFVLIGVATPGDLIRDPERTPFNIGQRVDLTDFTLAESSPLMDGLQEELGLSAPQAKKIMKEVWYWTEGHPYLTQKLCAALVEAGREMDVEHVMRQMFFGQKSNQDNNLQFVRDMLTRRSPNLGEVLRAYREIQRGKSVLDDEQLLVYSHLKLCGVVRRQNNKLVVRNRIYSKVFDRQWIRENLSENFWQRYWPVLKWAIPTATLAGVTMAMVVFLYEAQRQTQEAQRRNIEQLSTAASNDLTSDNHIDAAIKVLAAYEISKISNISMPSYAYDTLSKVILGIKEINQIPHDFGVSAIAFSKDGKFIASGDRGRNIRIWNVRTGEKKLDLIDEGNVRKNTAIYSIAFSHDGKKIVSGSIDKEIQLWSTETGKQIGKTLTGHKNEVFSVAFSHDDKTIISGGLDKEIILWDVEKQESTKIIEGHEETVFSVAFSPDDQKIVSGSWDKTVRLWNAKSGKQIGKPMKHDSRIYSVAFSPDGKKIVSASKDKKIRLWNTDTQKIEGKPFGDHTSIIYTVAFSSDGKKIVSGSWDNKVKLWDAEKKVKIGHPFVHNNIVYRVAFSPNNNKTVISGSLDKTLRIWNVEPDKLPYESEELENHRDGIHPIVFSPNGNIIASGGWAKTIKLHSLIGKKTIDIDTGRTIYSIAFSPDSQTIVSGGDNGKLRLWDVATGKEKTEILFKNNDSSDAHTDAIYGVAFSPDGKTIASGSWDRTLKLWDAKTGVFKKVLKGHKGLIYGIAFSHDGKKIVSGSGDKTLQLWDVANGQPIGKPLTGHEDNVHSVAFSLDDKEIVSGSLDQTIRFWDAETGKQQGKTVDSHKSVVYRVAYSPDGKKVISSSRDGVIRLWDAQTKEQIGHPFREHKDAVYSVAFSPDGKTIVSGSEDSSGDLLLWKLPDDKKLNLQLTLCQKLANHNLLKYPQPGNAKAAKKYCDEIIAKK